ncbi:hypothetical protein ANANG_G00131010 [Anguilla anguilla]|uniref:RING-type domain-containing protein n=1 Tax=Anguilla anguilla TaxID=7936 RepID=A0A9D3RY05_ANGAN|nr:hypothetical protein ANANG_G00131010 [Anguilla anguilla]
MPSPLFHLEIMEHEMVNAQHNGVSLPGETDAESRDEEHQEALRFAFDQLSLMAVEKGDCGAGAGLVDTLDAPSSISETCNGVGGGGYVGLQMLEHANGSLGSPTSCSPSPEYYGTGGYHMAGPHSMLGEPNSVLCSRKRSVNMTECVPVPSSEHVAEIVGRQGCKIKALRAKTNTYIKTPVRGEEPVFIVTGRREDVEMAKREILSAAEHFSMIPRPAGGRAAGPRARGACRGPHLPGQVTIQVRVPYRVVGLVVGPKGATIKRIQQQTHTYIVTPSREKDPVFEVTGMPENVDRAREEIETHITLRTGAFVDLQGDNDFHSNGTDVSLEGLSSLGLGAALWSRANPPPPPRRRRPRPPARQEDELRRVPRRRAGLGVLGGVAGAGAPGEREPHQPLQHGQRGGGFTFAGDPSPCLPPPGPPSAADELGFEFGSAHIWAPFANGGPQQRRNSSGPGGGASGTTPACPPPSPPSPPWSTRWPAAPRATRSAPSPGCRRAVRPPSPAAAAAAAAAPRATLPPARPPRSRGSPTDSEGAAAAWAGPAPGCSAALRPGVVVAAAVVGGAGMALAAANRDCYVCLESEVTAALVPCGHNLFCMDCAGHICQSSDPECPVCRTPATQCIRIFS